MFENIIGNTNIKTVLEKSIKQNKLSHSYLFVGTQGIGKKMIATEFAKMILCLDDNKYCNHCKSCIEFDTNNNPDFVLISPDGNNIKIEQIRDIQKRIQEKPIISEKKVYIIDNADLMTTEAKNCLLKTLEEPPEFAVIILIGSNSNTFLPTIKSRCTIMNFNKISDEEMTKYLREKCDVKNIDQNMLYMYQGSIGKALELKEKQEEYKNIENIINNINRYDLIDFINNAEILYKSKEEINDILDYINVILFNKAKDEYLYTNCIQIVENTKKRLKQNANYDMSIDNMLFNIWEEIN